MAFLYPWGNTQQLNLDWILQKIKELEIEGGGADLDDVANALISASYAVQAYDRSDIVFRDGKLYRANQAIPAPGEAWTPAHWDEILLGDTVSNLVQYVAALSNDQIVNSSTVTGTHTSDALDNLKLDLDNLTSDGVGNESQVTGDSVTDALDNLNAAVTEITPLDTVPTNGSLKGIQSDAVYDALNNVTLSNAITLTFSGVTTTAIINKKNGIINFNLNLGDGTSFSSATGYDTIGTVPDGFRPMTDMSFIGMARTTGVWASATYVPIYLVISATTGEITLRANASEIQTCKFIYCSFLWI